ncbi:MAG: mannonate dehydratase [Chloroflexi bacterium]|nr:mannonate dehydratase [Chloroflexota bacterium]
MAETMRVAIGIPSNPTDEHFRFVRQLGCEGVVFPTPARLPGEHRWEYEDLVRLREWVESFGLRIEAFQNTPHSFWHKVRLGLPGRDAELENYLTTIRNIGRAGIPVLGYNFRAESLYRTGTKPSRGGAVVTTFDRALVKDRPLTFGRVFTENEMWEAYEYFIKAAIPVAEEAGVRLALHPDDPPGPAIGGVARIFSSFEGFERGSRIVDSPNWGLDLCIGCWSEMGGTENVLRGIRHFGPRGQICYVHFREVQGVGDQFAECFIGDGDLDVTGVMRALKEVGFTGCMIDDHAPQMVWDTGWAPHSRAYQTGYLMGLLRAVNDLT